MGPTQVTRGVAKSQGDTHAHGQRSDCTFVPPGRERSLRGEKARALGPVWIEWALTCMPPCSVLGSYMILTPPLWPTSLLESPPWILRCLLFLFLSSDCNSILPLPFPATPSFLPFPVLGGVSPSGGRWVEAPSFMWCWAGRSHTDKSGHPGLLDAGPSDPCIPSPSACELSDPRAEREETPGPAELAPGPAGSGGWRLSRWMETMGPKFRDACREVKSDPLCEEGGLRRKGPPSPRRITHCSPCLPTLGMWKAPS